jgi:hypothetical protein
MNQRLLPSDLPAAVGRLPSPTSSIPNGRVFREWAAFPVADRDQWVALLDEARTFVDGV